MDDLAKGKCEPCREGAPLLNDTDSQVFLRSLPQWKIITVDGIKRLTRVFAFDNFEQALEFTNKVGAIAESEGHHPTLLTEWGKVTVTWWTHKIKGLHQNDFVMAAKTDRIV
jgi:4a-hydroxytetrahydrobiopterin dehydratase